MAVAMQKKEEWVHEILSALYPTFQALGFKKAGKTTYKRTVDEFECRYVISIRHPRYEDDPHQLYINPCIHVRYSELEQANSKLTGKPLNKDFPTLGGSVGLYKDVNSSEEWPIDDLQSAKALLPQLENDIKTVAIPFWDALSSRVKMLNAVDNNAKWSKRSDSWKYRHVILLFLERGIDEAMSFVAENQKKFREMDNDTLRDRLASLTV